MLFRGGLAFLFACVCMLAVAQTTIPSKRYLLIPVDDRPATSQFAAMIGDIASVEVDVPPQETLGKFTTPGSPDKVLDWLESLDLSGYDAVIASTDMFLYGGLIASREPRTSIEDARKYLRRFVAIRKKYPSIPFYGFSSVMRLSPTSTDQNKPYRELLVRAVVYRERVAKRQDLESLVFFHYNLARLPNGALDRYDESRYRNFHLQRDLLKAVKGNLFNYFIVGQDDAQPEGPNVPETQHLMELSELLDCREQVYFCEGIDQHSNVLVSRALTQSMRWTPKVRIVVADPLGMNTIPSYESSTLATSLREQLEATGAEYAKNPLVYDYSLYINTPAPRQAQFNEFLDNLSTELEQGFPVAVADVNLGKTGTGDPLLFDALNTSGRAMRLLSYSGWNTAGNTLGTAIPAANVYLLSRRMSSVDQLRRELQQRSFLLHRLVNDFEYHRYTRPQAYAMLDQRKTSRDEVYGEVLDQVNNFVKLDISQRLESLFTKQFEGKRFFAGTRQYELNQLSNIEVSLPWPRAFEVKIDFTMDAIEVGAKDALADAR